ncbi:glycogen synthase GlgA [Paenibacillus sp. 1P07SE]|uniref:glycogen synthase GlgA n=1 Tax=Paenibacillus sp. 1P07SE TaxID=3132209 RepID=UPI0039A5B02C
MKVLFAAAEGSPFMKTGGLADVVSALPKALLKDGVDVRVIMPKYHTIPENYRTAMRFVKAIEVPVGWRQVYCGIFELMHEGVMFYFLDSEYYFGARDTAYGHYDDGERFAFLDRAMLEALPHVAFQPDIIHSHDWHTGMVAPLLDKHYRHDPFYQNIRTVYTIHNLQFQGVFPYEVLGDLLGLDHDYFHPERLEYEGGVSFMKGGIVYADRVTTVSQTYADEIRTSYYGEGLDGALRWLGGRLSGIVNGIDDESYNPAADPHLFLKYSADSPEKKLANKAELQRVLGLEQDKSIPLIGMVTRLTDQKGLDLLAHVLQEILEVDNVQFAILGSGDPKYEGFLLDKAYHHPKQLAVQVRFDERLARQIYASSDLFLMPSRFEPCGLSQLLALRYGSIPIVRETGGLVDTVQAYDEYAGTGNGFSFTNYNAHDMLHTIRYALSFYGTDVWEKLVEQAMAADYSWERSAAAYKELYGEILGADATATATES